MGIGAPHVSPDGKKVAFIVGETDLEEDTYRTNIWVYNLLEDRLYQLTGGNKDSNPQWSPDSQRILFLSKRKLEEDEKGNELWSINVEGRGEARLILKRKGNSITDPKWCPDGKTIAFLSRVEEEPDVKVIERIPIWANGRGFTFYSPKNVFLVNVLTGHVTQFTDEDLSVHATKFSHDGKKVAYVVKANEKKPILNHLYVKPLKGGANAERITDEPMSISSIEWSPNDRKLAVLGHDLPRESISHNNLWVADILSKWMDNLTESIDKNLTYSLSFDAGKRIASRQDLIWKDGHIYFQSSYRGAVSLHRMHAETKEQETLLKVKGGIINFDLTEDRILYTKVDAVTPPELYSLENGEKRKLTHFNEELLEEIDVQAPSHFEFEASDGEPLEGWIYEPAEKDTQEQYPLLLVIHGGPKGMYGFGFSHTFQLYVSKGYGVVYFNPRGSDGYSEEFADIREHWGERDYEDLMEGIDYVLERYPWVDPEKLGVTGISYGGFMTNWIVTKTDRFKAAVSEEGICDWNADFGTSDIGFYFDIDHIGGTPWENPENYGRQSPIKYIENVETPTMLVHALDDYRCYLEQSLEFFTALKVQETPTKLVLFEKGGHGISRSGKPSWRVKRFKLILNWFDKYIKGKENLRVLE